MRWTLTKKVLLFSLAFLLLLVVFGMVAVDNIRKNAAVTNYLTGYIMQRAALSQDFDIAVARAIAEAQAFTFTYDPKDREEAVAAIAQAQAYVAELAVLHNQNDYGGAPTRAQNIQFHQRREALLLNAEEKVLAALRATDANNTAAAERARTALEAFEDEFEQLEQDAAAMIGRQVDTTVSTLQTRNAAGLQRTPGAFVLLAVAVVMLVMRLRRAVVQPINALSAAASTVAHGDLSPTVPVTSNDEIGALQHAFNHMVHSLRDQAAAQQQAEAELQHLALYDQLTHLPNRALFNDRLQHALMSLQRHHEHVAVLFLDLDNFKVVNDSLGHTSGDRLLTIVTERLCAAVRPNDTVARFGGDEFTILLDHVGGAHDAIAVAQQVLDQVQAPVLLDGHEVRPQASIGIALSTPQTRGADDLLRDADTALGRAKQNGKAQYQIFDPSMNVQAMERLQLEAELRHGLERGEFVLSTLR